MSSLREMAEDAVRSGRIVKFKTLVENINKTLEDLSDDIVYIPFVASIVEYKKIYGATTPFKLFFGTDTLNAFGEVIINSVTVDNHTEDGNNWKKKYAKLTEYDEKTIQDAAHEFIKICQTDQNASYKFVFWGLMIMSVDDSMQDERLSFICDFAKLTGISDDDLLDLVHIIRTIYYGEDEHYEYKSRGVRVYFKELINKYSEYKV